MSKACGIVVALLVLATASGCGSSSSDPSARTPPTVSTSELCGARPGSSSTVRADVDGSGRSLPVAYVPAQGQCPGFLHVLGLRGPATALVTDDLPVADHGFRAVTVPRRTGQLVLLVQSSPRGGYQAHLFGYAGSTFAELKVAGAPVLPFVATDTGSAHLTARCTTGGIEVEAARQASRRTWDLTRTDFLVEGNTVTAGPTVRTGSGVSDLDLRRQHRDLVEDRILTDCG
jgi:hypothetical protein